MAPRIPLPFQPPDDWGGWGGEGWDYDWGGESGEGSQDPGGETEYPDPPDMDPLPRFQPNPGFLDMAGGESYDRSAWERDRRRRKLIHLAILAGVAYLILK